jgi:signal transduction histidine kinase
MKQNIVLIIFLFQSVLFAQKKEYNFDTVAGVLEFQKNSPDKDFPTGNEKKIIKLLTQYEQSESYKLATSTDKLMVNAVLVEMFFKVLDQKEGYKYIKQYIDMYEAGYEKSKNQKINNSVNFSYRVFLLFYAENLSRNSSNLNEILKYIEKAKKVKIDFEKPDSYYHVTLFYEGLVYGNALYYDKAIKMIKGSIYYLKKRPRNIETIQSIMYCYYMINTLILENIIKKKLLKKEELKLLNDLDKNVLEIESINSENTNWSAVYSQKAYADYLRNNFISANKYIEKALATSAKKNYYNEYDYLLPKMYKLLILVKTKNYKPIEALRKEIEGDAYFKDLTNNIDFKYDLKEYYSALIAYEKDQNNYQQALVYTEKRQQILDDKRNEEFHLKMREFEKNKDILEKNIEITKQDNDKKQLIIFLIILNYLFLLFIAFGYFYIRKKRKDSEILYSKIKDVTENQINQIIFAKEEAIKELKKQFSMQLHTDVGSMLIATVNFLKIKKKIEPKQEDHQMWDSMIQELQKIYIIIRQESHEIYEKSYSNQEYLLKLEKNIQLIFNSNNVISLHTNFDIQNKTELSVDTKLSIIKLIKEGCTNILKHAKAKNININLVEDETSVILEIKDDGKPKFFKDKTGIGIGLKTLMDRILSMNGNLYFGKRENCDGFEIIASFPK